MNILLIRHGQAGTRTDYDTLSSTGRMQARLLGDYLASQRLELTAAISGGLKRQRETGEAALAGLKASGMTTPALQIDEGWNEFDLDLVYRDLGPQLAKDDPAFRTHWELAQAQIVAEGHDESSAINRRWNPADELVVRTWVQGRYQCQSESWKSFLERIRSAVNRLTDSRAEGTVAVFTSATPIAICTAYALGAAEPVLFGLAGAKMNTGITELRYRAGALRLFAFNGVPHLADPALRTHR